MKRKDIIKELEKSWVAYCYGMVEGTIGAITLRPKFPSRFCGTRK